ncbi:BTB/POZ domain-containing protein 9, variant 2 [Entomophthora muscae]|uniref:BTB/POZ domain-containing protein 9, variant 2 n=1 Tax=Entomophthora muscae TaxID=34485 RepID=A0ACC2UKN0_9FUNG|nr:BTB/POZ domain-containing protein 9, variant 2 [Entomophthora muscae]
MNLAVSCGPEIQSLCLVLNFAKNMFPFWIEAESSLSFSHLFNNIEFSDVLLGSNLCCNREATQPQTVHKRPKTKNDKERKIYAHKSVLSSSCRFFKGMFANGFQESKSPEILLDCDINTIEIILQYIYTKEIPWKKIKRSSFELWVNVFKNAHFMGLPGLSDLALWFSFSLVNSDGVFALLNLCKEFDSGGPILSSLLDFLKRPDIKIPLGVDY